ncbi:serine hydrolase domain-containing protein [Bradyrhizobium sp.]|uniref:serine hydrolase domain-containing protein n=1 Tax=Bradyrhizobium sp. TaxID=376 RepID=UPI0025BE9023|nr:serine hydrolase domain-containing protein [Bradyrhizobium sp.]
MASAAGADAAAPQAPLELTADNLAGVVDPLMDEWVGKHKGPGAVVVVVTRDGPLFAKGYGFSDIEAKKPFTADATLVRPGSISKLFTGIAVMQLVDKGRLDLDRDVNDYVDFAIPVPQGGVPVTLRRLLTHRAGFEEHAKDLFSRDREPQPLGPWLARSLPQRLFPNGDVEAYSNCGLALAGYIVERVSGEPYASYIQRHILDPLGMSHSTFRQPLPDDLKPLMAKGYRRSDQPPLPFFETITPAPAGALSATGEDMGRFVRALLNGGELDGVRILPKARLDDMMAPANATPAGYLGLVFFGTKVAGHDTIGHEGITMTFFSDLRIFPEQGIGVFVSRDGIGEIKNVTELPHPATAIARSFLPKATDGEDPGVASFPSEAKVAGIYQSSRRNESSFVRLSALLAQIVVKVDGEGHVRGFSAIWPFGDGTRWRRVERDLYQGSSGRLAFVDDGNSGSYLATPALRLQRVPRSLDARWIAPAFVASTVTVFLSLLAWPLAALWRYLRKKRWSEDSGERRNFLAVRLVTLVDAAVIGGVAVLFAKSSDYTIFNGALDPWLLALYAFAWLGVFGAVLTLWAVAGFWRHGTGGRWSRVHHTLIAASSVMIAWFFLTFHLAGTTLNY